MAFEGAAADATEAAATAAAAQCNRVFDMCALRMSLREKRLPHLKQPNCLATPHSYFMCRSSVYDSPYARGHRGHLNAEEDADAAAAAVVFDAVTVTVASQLKLFSAPPQPALLLLLLPQILAAIVLLFSVHIALSPLLQQVALNESDADESAVVATGEHGKSLLLVLFFVADAAADAAATAAAARSVAFSRRRVLVRGQTSLNPQSSGDIMQDEEKEDEEVLGLMMAVTWDMDPEQDGFAEGLAICSAESRKPSTRISRAIDSRAWRGKREEGRTDGIEI